MRVLVAANALKESLGATQAAAAIAAGVRAAAPDWTVTELAVADGGDGLIEALSARLPGLWRPCQVTGPRGAPVEAGFLWLPERATAIIEMARASGLALLPPAQRDPRLCTSLGTGELVRAALDAGARCILLGLGGSATVDGGIGLATALGARFVDASGSPVPPVGGKLAHIARIELAALDPRLAAVSIEALCDVDNPLTGPDGAALVFGPQKFAPGLAPEARGAALAALDAGLDHLARRIATDLGCQVRDLPGAGAAGGLGAGLVAFCAARLVPGAETVLDLLDFDRLLADSALVITAEGRLDAQSCQGKAPVAVARRARRLGIPCLGMAGELTTDPEARSRLHEAGFTALFSLCPGPLHLDEALARAAELLAAAAGQAVRALRAGQTLCQTLGQPGRPGPDGRSP